MTWDHSDKAKQEFRRRRRRELAREQVDRMFDDLARDDLAKEPPNTKETK